MPAVKSGAVRKMAGGTWSYRLPRDPVTGRRKQVGGFKTKGEASDALRAEMERIRQGTLWRPSLTFGQLCDEFFGQYVGVTEKTRTTMRESLVRARARFEDVPIERLDARTIAAWRATLPPRSAQKYLVSLKQVLNYAVRVRLLDRNPAADVPAVPVAVDEIVPFESWDDVERIAAALDPRFRPIPVFATGTGLRPEEWIALRVGDVSIAERVVTVKRVYSSRVWRDAPEKGKGARRRVPLRARVIDALRDAGRIGPGVDPKALLFPSYRGGPIDLHNWREREWNPAVIEAGFSEVIEGRDGKERTRATRRPYVMRHTYAAWGLAAGVNVYTLARRMGTSVEMIDKTYGHFARDAEEYERDLLDAYDAVLAAGDDRTSATG